MFIYEKSAMPRNLRQDLRLAASYILYCSSAMASLDALHKGKDDSDGVVKAWGECKGSIDG